MPSWRVLFEEAFNGVRDGDDGTWFAEKKEAIFPILDQLSAGEASRRFGPGVNTIAAHAFHVAFYIRLGSEYLETESSHKVDWEDSWRVQEVNDAEWEKVRQDLRVEYHRLLANLESYTPKTQDSATGVLAHLAHAAFHLGTIRQLAKME